MVKVKQIILLVLLGGLLAVLQGCIEIPDPYLVIGQRDHGGTVEAVSLCDPDALKMLPATGERPGKTLDGDGFNLLNWNMFKGRKAGWEEDFKRLIAEGDVILLQEAHLTDALTEVLRRARLNWSLATAFRYQGAEAGVLTASRTELLGICMQRFLEPVVKTPKTSLVARFPLTTGEELVVVNLHAINFTVDDIYFRRFWQEMETILQPHEGPLVVAGDFNTWSAARQAIVVNTTERLGLTPVQFPLDQRTLILDRPIDHIYCRGLVPVDAVVYEVSTSDHNPMRVTFKLANNHTE